MKAIQFFAIAALGAALFASCSSEEELAQSNYPMDNVVRIMTSVDGMNTKHSHPHFTGNDKGLVSLYSTNLPIPISMQVLFLF